MKKKKKLKSGASDYGPGERLQHGRYEEFDTDIPGVKAIRNVTVDPITAYRNRKTITARQVHAADIFAAQYRRAALGPAFTQVKYDDRAPGGEMSLNAVEAIQHARNKVHNALKHVGQPLSGIIQHVCGDCLTAGTWSGVASSKRQTQDGMAALRLALTGLAVYYRL